MMVIIIGGKEKKKEEETVFVEKGRISRVRKHPHSRV
jgi:hypothetical protein